LIVHIEIQAIAIHIQNTDLDDTDLRKRDGSIGGEIISEHLI